MTARPYCAPRYAAPRKPFAFSPGAQPQAQSCLSPSLDSTESSAGERRERRRERKRGRACSGGAGGPPAGSVPREAILTAGGRRCDTAAPLRRRAGSRLRWPAASAPHCLSQSLRDQRTRTQLALQTYRAQADADSVITRAGSKDASTEERDTQPANTPRCPV